MATAAGVARSGPAAASGGIGSFDPIPATIDFFPPDPRGIGHVQAPPFDPPGAPPTDPGTIFNFTGAVGIVFISGQVERRDRRTGETRTLPYVFNDMRYMKGVVRNHFGVQRHGTFAFI